MFNAVRLAFFYKPKILKPKYFFGQRIFLGLSVFILSGGKLCQKINMHTSDLGEIMLLDPP